MGKVLGWADAFLGCWLGEDGLELGVEGLGGLPALLGIRIECAEDDFIETDI